MAVKPDERAAGKVETSQDREKARKPYELPTVGESQRVAVMLSLLGARRSIIPEECLQALYAGGMGGIIRGGVGGGVGARGGATGDGVGDGGDGGEGGGKG